MMNLPILALLIDSIAIILLATVIVYSIRLNKYFTLLRNGKDDLARQLSAFADSTKRAEEAIDRMKLSTRENANLLDQQIRRAELVRKDLSRDSRNSGVGVGKAEDELPTSSRRRKPAEASDDATLSARRGTVASTSPSPARDRLMRHRRAPLEESEGDTASESGDISRRQRSKSKSELLKALQGMR